MVWLVVGAVATSTYLLILALQFRLAAHRVAEALGVSPEHVDAGG